jgi:hypothetical protein
MTRGEFSIGLAKRVFVFAVVIPGLFVLSLMALGDGPSSPAIGLSYIGYFIGIPLWIVAASIVLWRHCRARMRSIGLPGAMSLIVIPFALADWRFFLWLFQPFHAPFLLTILLLLVALMLWPDANRGEGASSRKAAPLLLGGCLLVQLILAVASIVGSVGFVINTSRGAFMLTAYAGHYALWWNAAIAAAMIWTLIEAGRTSSDRS